MAKRMYLVELKRKKVLVEASSRELAVKIATAPLVKSVTIPTPLEVARLMRDDVETIAPSIAPAKPPEEPPPGGEGAVGRLGLGEAGADDTDQSGERE